MKRERFKLDVSVFVLLKRKDGMLLFIERKADEIFEKTWSFPAGALDPDETLIAAAARETKEEVGVIVAERALRLVHTIHCLTNGTEWLGMFFLARTWDGEPQVMEPDRHVSVAWRSPEGAPDNTRPYVKQAIKMYLHSEPFSSYGWETKTP